MTPGIKGKGHRHCRRRQGLGEAAARRLDQDGAELALGARRLERLRARANDVILNNAGLMPFSPLERLKVQEWDRTIDVNLKGVLYGIAAALPHMKAQRCSRRGFANLVAFALGQPENVDINEIMFRPTSQEVLRNAPRHRKASGREV